MTADPKAVQELFALAIAITECDEREKFLTQKCEGNKELHARVVKLLAAYNDGAGLLESPTNALAATMMHARSTQQPGHVIAGRYKLLESIGEGGMGTVWVAEQTQPVRRKVAIKLVKPGMDSKQVLARFDAERQALALMDHPNIAKVFDGGVTEQGRPFFAMEYVKGMPLTAYCDQMRLPVEERLKLFVPICQAVQHAHQKGIIHRDLKPSNVLICLYDGKPVPKVIDFGLAKAMYQPLTEQTVHTGHGLMIGTPLYMSPEQAEQNNLDVDTRTDIYSLGVMLYELLTGSTPLEKAQFKDAAFGEILRLIKEVEPPKPSTRVSSSANLPTIAAQRNLDSKQLGRSIRGDLDWIVMKAIEKERERRYDTANGLARDIERFLSLEAVEACPPSASYRLRRLARKHRAMLGTAAAFAMILVLGAGVSLWQAFRATEAEKLASQRLVDVRAEQSKTQEALDSSLQSERRATLSESQATAKSNELQVLTEEQRRVIYVSEMNQVRIEAQRGNLARMREILLQQLPIDGKEDLRGFEWNYWYRYLNQANVESKFEKATIDSWSSALVTVLPGGKQVAWTAGKNTELVDLDTGASRRVPFQLRHYVDRTPFSENGRAVVGACLSHTYPVGTYKPPGTDQGSSTSCSVVEPTGQVHTFDYPTDGFKHVSALNISRDGSLIVVIGYDATHTKENAATRICVWNVDSKQLALNEVYRRELNRISFSPDGKKLAAHLCHGTKRSSNVEREVAVIVDVATGRELSVVANDDDIDSLFWIPGSDRVLLSTFGFSGSNRKQLLSWRISDAKATPVLLSKENMPDYANGVVSPDGSTLAITSHQVQQIRLFDTARGDLIDTLHTDGKGIVSLTYSSDGRQLVAITVSGDLLRWDLGKDRDLFGLRTNPLPRLATNGYALSQDQSLLAIALADGAIVARTRAGVESKLKAGIPKAALGTTHVKISADNKLLAVLSNVGPDGKALVRGKGLLEVYDLVEKKRLWQTIYKSMETNVNYLSGSGMEFSSDGQKLVPLGDASVFDSRTGKGTEFDLQEKLAKSLALQRNPQTGTLFAAFAEFRVGDPVLRAGVYDPLSGTKLYSHRTELPFPFLGLAPDGIHGCIPHPSGVEVWNLAKGERVVSVPGTYAILSPDSKRFAALTSSLPSNAFSLSRIVIWDLASRRQLCELPLAGGKIDEARFSPDGKRLLTLEGKTRNSNMKISRGRLWDVETGREILDLPVAEVNHYDWDLFFDDSGQQLTQLLFSKTSGTSSGGKTAFYDARPLEPSVDNGLSADRLMTQLKSRLALKREWITEIESRTKLKPGIREAVLEKIRDSIANPEDIAKLTGEIVGISNRSLEDYQRAVTWAEELHRLEPDSVRSRTLLGAAYYRTNRLVDAQRILTSGRSANTPPTSVTEKGYEKLRHAVLGLVHFRNGKKREAQVSIEQASTNPGTFPEYFPSLLALEARRLIPISKSIVPTNPESMPKEDDQKKTVEGFLFGNTDLELSRLPRSSGYRLVNYDNNQDQRLNQEEMIVAFRDMYRFGVPIAMADWQSSVEANLEFLEETIRDAPQYLTARFVRAWVHATCADPQFRDTEKALQEAKYICEQTKYQDATFLESLAAAYAASGDFSSAIRWQTEAIRLHGKKGSRTFSDPNEAQGRLAAYEKNQVSDSKLPHTGDLIIGSSRRQPRERDVSAPYLSPEYVLRAKRIVGSGAAWSPDGTRIVRSIKSDGSGLALEWIDLKSGQTQLVCTDGASPVWTTSPSERVYFARRPIGVAPTPSNATIWHCDSDGKNLTRLMDGTPLSQLKDGSLLVEITSVEQSILTRVFKGFQIEPNGTLQASGLQYQLEDGLSFGKLSPDGKRAAECSDNLVILEIPSKKVMYTYDLISRGLGTASGAWSPDSRFYAYGNLGKSTSGLWILDVTSGENRLLADIDATNPSWSHDSRFIAVDERGKNQIVILDVSSLYLENGLGNAKQQSP